MAAALCDVSRIFFSELTGQLLLLLAFAKTQIPLEILICDSGPGAARSYLWSDQMSVSPKLTLVTGWRGSVSAHCHPVV